MCNIKIQYVSELLQIITDVRMSGWQQYLLLYLKLYRRFCRHLKRTSVSIYQRKTFSEQTLYKKAKAEIPRTVQTGGLQDS